MNRRAMLLAGTAAAAVSGGLAYRSFDSDLALAIARTEGRSQIVQTRFGRMEYAVAGAGAPVLMIHGTGGGFDQGLDFTMPIATQWQIIAPSRFGYLRSEVPPDPSSENQADAFVDLLDHLGIARAGLIGGSAGALSALQFAIRHPDRLSALIALVPASYAPGRPPVRPPNRFAQAIIDYALKSDAVFWAGTKLAETRMIGALLATDSEVFNHAGADEQARARAILRNILPISRRTIGLGIDARLSSNPKPMAIAEIRAPTLAISLEDDRFQTAAAARHITATVPGAKLKVYPTGGHIWLGHNGNVFAAIDSFLSRELGSSNSQEIR